MKLVIDSMGKLGHLTGKVQRPANTYPNLCTRGSENSFIIVWLINSMEQTVGKTYLFLPTAEDV